MFGNIRDKIQNLQENLSMTLRGLSVSDSPPARKPKEAANPVNPNAGTALLEKFQSSWSELHNMSQENATKAQEVDDLIFDLHKSADKQWKAISHLTGILTSLPELINSMNALHCKTMSLRNLFREIEEELIVFEDVLNEKAYETQVIEQKFQLALYEQTRLGQLESLRISLEEKHKEKEKINNAKKQFYMKDESGIDYSEDIKSFKEPIPKIKLGNQSQSVKSLDEIVLENENPEVLDEFLNEELPNQKS